MPLDVGLTHLFSLNYEILGDSFGRNGVFSVPGGVMHLRIWTPHDSSPMPFRTPD